MEPSPSNCLTMRGALVVVSSWFRSAWGCCSLEIQSSVLKFLVSGRCPTELPAASNGFRVRGEARLRGSARDLEKTIGEDESFSL